MKNLLLLFTFLFLTVKAFSQKTPVKVVLQLPPPYSVFLSDYTDSEVSRMQVLLTLNDIESNDIEVKLKFTIKGSNNVTIETKPEFLPVPTKLSHGQLEILSGEDLSQYFNPANLNFEGLDRTQFLRTKRLPEGLYTFYVEVFEYRRGTLVSNKEFKSAWIVQNDPPRWVLPIQNQVVKATLPQNVLFNWLPMHTGSPNSAFTTEYEFTMVEIWPQGRNPNDAINAQAPFYRETLNTTSLIMGPSETQMVPGRSYAVRVQAKDTRGRDLFKNNGFSEVLIFTFGEECRPPFNLSAKPKNYKSVDISWLGNPKNTGYTLKYREKGSTNSEWYTANTLFIQYNLNELNPGKTYEYQLTGDCETLISDASETGTFTLPPKPSDAFSCSPSAQAVTYNEAAGKPSLAIGDELKIAGYSVTVKSVTGANGRFSGGGVVKAPFLNNVSLTVKFDNIFVNNSNQVTQGNVIVTGGQAYALDDATRATIKNGIAQVQNTATIIQSTLSSADAGIKDASDLIKNVSALPSDAKKAIQDAKALMEQGKAMVQAGNTEQGQNLIEQGKKKLQDGLNKAGDAAKGVAGAVTQGADKLKEIFENVINSKRDTAQKDSSTQKSAIILAQSNYEKLKKEFEGDIYTPDSTFYDSEGAIVPEGVVYVVLSANETSDELKTPLALELNDAANQKIKREIDWKLLERKLAYLRNLKGNNQSLDDIINSFKNESVNLLKNYALNSLTGQQQSSLETQVRAFLTKKMNEYISSPN